MLALLLILTANPDPPVLDAMKTGAKAYAPRVKTAWVKQWMTAVANLPSQPKRTVDVPQPDGGTLTKTVDDELYYGRITAPLDYARAYEVLATKAAFNPKGKRVLDFGYGNIGQLEGLVSVGASAAGIEVDPALPLIYAKANRPKLRILHGYFPTDPALIKSVGTGWDLFISKNTLKRGYVHPPEGTRAQIPLDDDAFLGAVSNALAPKGLFYLYNISPGPAPEGQPFKPWSDGRCPFDKAVLEKHGFDVIAFDEDDTDEIKLLAKAMAWEDPDDLFAHWTLVRKH